MHTAEGMDMFDGLNREALRVMKRKENQTRLEQLRL
jgi:hypothetical protein